MSNPFGSDNPFGDDDDDFESANPFGGDVQPSKSNLELNPFGDFTDDIQSPSNPFDDDDISNPFGSTTVADNLLGRTETSGGTPQSVIFSRKEIDPKPAQPITYMAVSCDKALMGMGVNRLQLFDTANPKPDSFVDVELPKLVSKFKVSQLFMDPTGQHCLIAVEKRGLCYFNVGMKLIECVARLGDKEVTAVAWGSECKQHTTGPILIGTATGQLYEISLRTRPNAVATTLGMVNNVAGLFSGAGGAEIINVEEIAGQRIEVYCEELYKVNGPISDIIFSFFPRDQIENALVFVSCLDEGGLGHLYQFTGLPNIAKNSLLPRPSLLDIFASYPSYSSLSHKSLPGVAVRPQLSCSWHRRQPQRFAWLTAIGVWFSTFELEEGRRTLLSSKEGLLKFSPAMRNQKILGLALVQFHVLVLFERSVAVYSLLMEKLEQEDTSKQPMLGLCHDTTTDLIWVWARNIVYKYTADDPTRGVWHYYMRSKNYVMAQQYCETDLQRNDLWRAQADDIFSSAQEQLAAGVMDQEHNFEKAAMLYASSTGLFQSTVLKFLSLPYRRPLRVFLIAKLRSATKKSLREMLVLWLCDLFSGQLGLLRAAKGTIDVDEDAILKLQYELNVFLNDHDLRVADSLRQLQPRIYSVFISNGCQPEATQLALQLKDWATVLDARVQNKEYKEALRIIQETKDRTVLLQYLNQLIINCPKECMETLSRFSSIPAESLIPALVQLEKAKPSEEVIELVIKYLEDQAKAVARERRTFSVIYYDYLLMMYVQHSPNKVYQFLLENGDSLQNVTYSVKNAIQLCRHAGLHEALLHLYVIMDMHYEAVNSALQINEETAFALATKLSAEFKIDSETERHLWLKIAAHMIESGTQLPVVIQKIRSNCDLLKLEDLLPLFPNFNTLDSELKKILCKSLQECSGELNALKKEMDRVTQSSQALSRYLKSLGRRHTTISPTDKCYTCQQKLLLKEFYVFPCRHMFHEQCVKEELAWVLSPSQLRTLGDLTNECPVCGDRLIKSISRPFSALDVIDDLQPHF